jgi:S-layer protein
MALTVAQQVQQLYVGTFGRASDKAGFDYWVNQVNTGALTINQVSDSFFAQPETQALYPSGTTNISFIWAVYQNAFHRVPDGAGAAYWDAQLTNNVISRGQFILAVLSGAKDAPTATPPTFDLSLITNQTIAAQYYTDSLAAVVPTFTVAGALAVMVPVTFNASSIAVSEALTNEYAAGGGLGQTFTLTTAVDSFVGGAGNDLFVGNSVEVADFGLRTYSTFTPLDSLDGGAGRNTFNIVSTIAVANVPSATVKNIQTANITGASNIGFSGNAFDTSAWTGLTSLNILKGADAYLNAAGTTAVAVSGVTGALVVDGGSTVNVTAGTGSGDVIIGATTVSTGAVTVTDTALGTNDILIDGGTAVTVIASGVTAGGTITVGNGGAATDLPTGAVSVTSTGTAYAITDASNTLSNIIVKGGSTVTVNQTAYSSTIAAATDTSNVGVVRTQGAVSVTGGAAATAVTVNQSAAVASVDAVTAIAGGTEAVNEVFVALTVGQTLIVGGLTFTAGAAGTTAAQTAAAFANLSSGAAAGNSTLGSYLGSFTGWNTGAVTATSTVLFTSSTANTATAAPAFTGTGTAPGATVVTTGVTTVVGVTGVAAVAANTVTVYDANFVTKDNVSTKAGTITTITASNFTSASIGDTALTTLNVTNGSGNIIILNGGLTTATNKTLALNINGQTAGTLDDADIYTTLNVTTSGAASTLSNITFGAMTALTVAGDKALTLSSATGASKLATVTVSGAAGLTADLSVIAATVTSVNASATSGANTITLDATKATYTGGTGVDKVTTSAVAPTKAISLGAGDDSLTLVTGTVSSTGLLDGGEGTDTLVMVAANAATASASTVFETKIANFEKLSLTGGTTDVVDLANLDDISYVSTAGNTLLTLSNMTNAGTLQITGNTTAVTVVMTDATGVADSFNVALASAATIAAGTVTVAGVETIAITSNDTNADTANSNSLTVVADAATAITVSGNAALSLTSTAALVTTVNASAMTAGLTYTTAATAQTVTGGTGNDVLTASGTAAQTLIGGAGNDTLVTNAGLSTLTGGLGADKFVITTPGANVNIYATTDATIGDTIQFASLGVETFNATKLTLGSTAVFQDYANLAARGDGLTNAALSWFQFAGNTFVVEDRSEIATFDNGVDLIVQLTGLVDLSHTSINTSINTTDASLLIG